MSGIWLAPPKSGETNGTDKLKEVVGVPLPAGDFSDADETSFLRQHHDAVMRRLDVQEGLLLQLLACGRLLELPETEESSTLVVEAAAVEEAEAFFESAEVAGDSATLDANMVPMPHMSYTEEDLQLQESAMTVAATRKRRRFSTRSVHGVHPARGVKLRRFVQTQAFEAFFALVVLSNAVFIGIEVDSDVASPGQRPMYLYVVQYLYTILFMAELVLRVAAFGVRWSFRYSEDKFWTWLDLFIVISALWEVVVDIVATTEFGDSLGSIPGLTNLKSFRLVRLTRLLKMSQFVRIFRFVMALRTLVASIVYTLKALLWALVLLVLIVYVFAILFTQAINDHRVDPDSAGFNVESLQASEEFWASVPDSMMSLFMSITGGVSWHEVLPPLKEMSAVWVFCFLLYIAFTLFAVLNVVTGVFCQSAIQSAQNDDAAVMQTLMDDKEKHLSKLRKLFSELGLANVEVITFEAFEEKLDTPAVRDYFESLGLDVRDAWTFFRLLDSDGNGSVEVEEFFMGCLRFRGAATSLDMGRILQDQRWLIKKMDENRSLFRTEMATLQRELRGLQSALRAPAGTSDWAPSQWKA